jgi:hypothetical protein
MAGSGPERISFSFRRGFLSIGSQPGTQAGIEPIFWVSGLAAFFLAAMQLSPLQGESLEWACYLLLGSLLPATVIAASSAECRGNLPPHWTGAKYLLGGLFLLSAGVWVGTNLSGIIVLTVALQAVLTKMLTDVQQDMRGTARTFLYQSLPRLLLISIAWLACIDFVWWRPLKQWHSSTYGVTVFILSITLAVIVTHGKRQSAAIVWKNPGESGLDIVALALLALASMKMGFNFPDVSFVTGTIDLVKQGGWLLWEVPSQYGFLNILVPALFPLDNSWVSLYVVSSALFFVSAWIVYSALKGLGQGVLHKIASLLLTLSSVLMLPGWAPRLAGPISRPQVAAFRFIWVYVLLWILILLTRSGPTGLGSKFSKSHLMAAGSLCWLLGTLWSAESAIYCGLVWLPAAMLIVFEQSRSSGLGFRPATYQALRFLTWQAATLTIVLIGIACYYLANLGTLPDWFGFIEHATAYKNGFGSIPMDLNGLVWWMLLGFCGMASTLPYFWKSDRQRLPLVVAALAAVWATHSYYVNRSHENNITNLTPIMLIAIVIVLRALRQTNSYQAGWLAAIMVPFFTMAQVAAFSNTNYFPNYLASLFEARTLQKLVEPSPELFALSADLNELLNVAGVRKSDPMVFISDTLVPRQQEISPTYWLPAAPATQLAILSPERQDIYLSRFLARRGNCGWLLQPLALANSDSGEGRASPDVRPRDLATPPILPSGEMFTSSDVKLRNLAKSQILLANCRATKRFENTNWRIEWYEQI